MQSVLGRKWQASDCPTQTPTRNGWPCCIATAVLALTHQAGQSVPILAPISARELLRILRATVLPQPRRDLGHLLRWPAWRRHQYRATLCQRRWSNITPAAAP